MKKLQWVLGIVICLGAAAGAATYTWTGGGADASWATTANWSPTPSPNLTGADLIFASSGTQHSNFLGATLSIKGVTFDSGAPDTYVRLSSLGTGSGVRNLGLNVVGSYITVNSGANGNYTMDGPGALLVNQNIAVNHHGNGILTLGKFTTSTTANYGITKNGTGTLVLSGANTFTGAVAVAQGTLLVNGNSSGAIGTVSVAANAILGGSGTIGGNVLFADGAKFLFNAAETLTVAAGKTVAFDGFGVDDLIGLDGTVSDGTYTLIAGDVSFDNVSNVGLANAFALGGGKQAYFEEGSLALVVIPEPASIGLMIIGAASAIFVRRRIR